MVRGILTMAIVVLCLGLAGADESKTRNPFKVADVADPDGKDVQEFAEKAKLAGDAKDDNAAPWAKEVADGKSGSLQGSWDGRWNGNGGQFVTGTAQIKVVGDRVYILYKDDGGSWLIDAKRTGKKLIGRYVGVDNTDDTTPFVGQIIDDERIDGAWRAGRWDFRRKLPVKKD